MARWLLRLHLRKSEQNGKEPLEPLHLVTGTVVLWRKTCFFWSGKLDFWWYTSTTNWVCNGASLHIISQLPDPLISCNN